MRFYFERNKHNWTCTFVICLLREWLIYPVREPMNLPWARLNCSNCISYLLSHYLSLVSCLSISLFPSLDPSQCLLFIALLLFHYFLRYSPPLSSFLSAECCVAHRRVLCYSSPLVVLLRRLLCHTPSCSSDIPHTYAIKLWVKNLTLTTIIQYLFYIRSSKENWPNVKKYQWKTIEDLKRTYCNFFTNDLSSSSSSVSDFASHSWPPTIAATWRRRWRKHLPHFKSERRTFELATWPISQKISLLCWFNRSRKWFWEEEGLPFYTRRSMPRRR